MNSPLVQFIKYNPLAGNMLNGEVILIAVNVRDIASTNQADFLRQMVEWTEERRFEGHPTYAYAHLRMIYLPNGLLFEDHLDLRWTQHSSEHVREVIFPSRHVAASGQASLTLHPIGIPHARAGEVGEFGGHGGKAPPPSPRLGPWWRMLLQKSQRDSRVDGFEVSLEVTHHGPFLNTPCLFIEVGSTEATWGHTGAAEVLAEIIFEGLIMEYKSGTWDPVEHAGQAVIITLGGGHYAPRANLLGAVDGVWLGHMLATYALPFEQKDGMIGGAWKQSLLAAISSTRDAFPQGKIVCSMDKKAFKGWQRQAIRDVLEEQKIPLLTSSQIQSSLT